MKNLFLRTLNFVTLIFCCTLAADQQLSGERPTFRAEDFIESMGINAAPFQRYLSEGRWAGAGTKHPPEYFFDLGIRYYRTCLRNDLVKDEQPERVAEWYRNTGIRPMLLIDPGKSKTLNGDFSFLLDDIKKYQPGSIAAISGPNEVNNKFPPQEMNLKYKGLTDELAGAAYQRDLFNALRGDPLTKDIPVISFTAIFTDFHLAHPCDSFDYLSVHPYQGDSVPSSSLLMNMTRAYNILPIGAPIKPFHITECGYNVEEDVTNRQGYIGSRRAQAYNIPMLFAEYFRHGIGRTYLFALPNVDGYGLLESDQETKRPSWYAVQSMVSILSDSVWDKEKLERIGGRNFEPRTLRFRLLNAPATVHTLTLQKENQDWYLMIWNEIQNFRGGNDLKNPAVPIKIKFDSPVKLAAIYSQGEIPDDVYAHPDGPKQGAFRELHHLPDIKENIIEMEIPSKILILRLIPLDTPSNSKPKPPLNIEGEATENSVKLQLRMPQKHDAVSILLFRNDMHIASFDTNTEFISYNDSSAWIRPGLTYKYSAYSVATDGNISKKIEKLIVTPNRRPNLILDEFGPDVPQGYKIKPGDKIEFKGTIKNIGSGATPNPTPPNTGIWNSFAAITFAVNGKVISWGLDSDQKPIQPGEKRHIIATGGPDGNHIWIAEKGSYNLTAIIDDINRISTEINETDNIASRTITVGDYPGLLLLESRPASGRINLTSEGTLDWVHFGGWNDNGIISRKKGSYLISNIEQIGNGYIDVNPGCPLSLSWNDGEGIVTQEDSYSGLCGNCVGNGFTFSVQAEPEERILKIYVSGSDGIQGKFYASLSDNSAPEISCDSWNANRGAQWTPVPDSFSAVYIVRFRSANKNQKLKIKWEMYNEPNKFHGQIRIQAATLSKP